MFLLSAALFSSSWSQTKANKLMLPEQSVAKHLKWIENESYNHVVSPSFCI